MEVLASVVHAFGALTLVKISNAKSCTTPTPPTTNGDAYAADDENDRTQSLPAIAHCGPCLLQRLTLVAAQCHYALRSFNSPHACVGGNL
jgi:hypothetical protein